VHVSRLRSQAGVTLIELLVAMSIGLVTVFAAIALLETSSKQSIAVAARVNATQRGRITMDTITRELRSQVCYSPVVPALVSATDDSVKFHADLSDGTRPIEQRELVFDPTAQTIVERTWAGVGTPITFPTMTKSRQLLSDVTRRAAPNAPIFRYYAYTTATPPRPDTVPLPTPLSATDLARVAKVDIGYTTLPPKGGTAGSAVTLQNEIYVRVADPNDPAPTPTCA
jgi:prepilin-type N-terminal cleavage/methylation domain-containing protein